MNVNKVILVGRLTEKPELRATNSGQNVARLGIATNRTYTDKNGEKQESVEFHNALAFGKIAEVATSFLDKGSLAYVEGRLQTRTYTDREGVERKSTEIIVENLQLGPRPQPQPKATPAPKAETKAEKRPSLDDEDTERQMQELFGDHD